MILPHEIDKSQAQVFMSQLLDGELSGKDAERLHAYLEQHPGDLDWMEGFDAIRETNAATAGPADKQAALTAIYDAVEAAEAPSLKDNLLAFPIRFRPLATAAAAAIAVIGVFTWMNLDPKAARAEMEPAIVEFVATDIPDASTFIYSDEESGWTVVWVETSEANADHG